MALEFSEWVNSRPPAYSDFFRLSSPIQLNPFGVAGYPPAMERLETPGPERPSTSNNPFSNVPIVDYDTSQKYSRAAIGDKRTSANFYEKLIRSPEDAIFNRQSSERQFYTTNNSSVPNEATKFAQWCYGKNFVCKSGSIYDRYGYPYTPDSLVCNGFNAAVPENAGQVENNFGTPGFRGTFYSGNNINYGSGFGGIPGAVPNSNIDKGPRPTIPMPLVDSCYQ